MSTYKDKYIKYKKKYIELRYGGVDPKKYNEQNIQLHCRHSRRHATCKN